MDRLITTPRNTPTSTKTGRFEYVFPQPVKKEKKKKPKDDMDAFLDDAMSFLKKNPSYKPKDNFLPEGLEKGHRGRGKGYDFVKIKDAPGAGLIILV